MKHPRPTTLIRGDLETALAYRDRYETRPTSNPLVLMMRSANEKEIASLETELQTALTGDLEMTLVGPNYSEHRVSVRYITRVLDALQSSFRAMYGHNACRTP
jgi:hypothetical protein